VRCLRKKKKTTPLGGRGGWEYRGGWKIYEYERRRFEGKPLR